MNPQFWIGKKVFLTGHTGFKGSWLALWLRSLGAAVTGFALPPIAGPNLFEAAGVESDIDSRMGDVRDLQAITKALVDCRPEVVLHLAAQSLVGQSYRDPVETYSSNVMGVVNLLEAVRACGAVRVVLVVTSDKCYENREWVWGYRESDPLGGHDPYSSSKGCAELVAAAYRHSYFSSAVPGGHCVALATARAGNVIGGGDWSRDRLVPDVMRALFAGGVAEIRDPDAVRPWQHVLEPLAGYLKLIERMWVEGPVFAEAWNFGPGEYDARTVRWVIEELSRRWGEGAARSVRPPRRFHEARLLKLDSAKSRSRLGWSPCLDIEEAIDLTVSWYRTCFRGGDVRQETLSQISRYQERVEDTPTAAAPGSNLAEESGQ